MAFYLIDCDCFKEINDIYGHEVGDQVLIEVGRRISSAIRHSDVLVRWGGDEFLVVSRYMERSEASALAARVLNTVGREPFELKDTTLRRTCSIGWVVFPWFVGAPQEVPYNVAMRLADLALYEAKKAGRNQAVGMVPSRELPLPEVAGVGGKHDRLTELLSARALCTPGPEPAQTNDSQPLNAAKAMAAAVPHT